MPYQPAVLGTARLNNFRLNYLTADQAADRATHIRIILDGIDITRPESGMRVIYKSMTIRDLLFDAPNTCALTLYGPAAPHVGQPLEVWIDSNAPVLLFGGEIQTVNKTYKGQPATVLHPVTAIDDTARANRLRPLRPYVNVSATTIAQELMTSYAPGFSTAGVEAGLPAVSITFDGSEGGMKGCLTALAKLVGGYWYFENKTLYFFVTPIGPAPDPIDDTPGRFLHDPAITWSIDKSQVRTRVYGKGAGTRITASMAAGETLVPLENAEMFTATGGQAIAGLTPDGATCRVLTYTGVQAGGGGGLVGPGATPAAAPGLTNVDGSGIENGVHKYAYTFTTAAGESLPSPIAAITVGPLAPPASSPIPGAPTAGGAVDAGTYQYALTFVTAVGETISSPGSANVTVPSSSGYYVPAPTATPSNVAVNGNYTPGWAVGDVIAYRIAYYTATGETTASPMSPGVTGSRPSPFDPDYMKACRVGLQVSADPYVIGRRVFRYKNGALVGKMTIDNNAWTSFEDYSNVEQPGVGPQGSNTALVGASSYQTVPLTGIAIGPANVTARKLYRWSSALGWKLLTTIANNTQTTYTDTTANASLGAAPPATNTALANWVRINFAVGGAAVTGRKIYRSKANVDPLQLAYTIANNTTTVADDNNPDASLGVAAPATDTSGLTQPNGQVPAGSTTMIVANTTPFATGGGWAIVGNGEQAIRYTAKSASALTGIPATGPGALVAAVAYNSTVTAAPALVGVTGVLEAIIRNAPIQVWVQRDDPAAQAYMAALDGGGDGVYEHIWSDERRTEASLRQVCDAQLKLYSRPLVTVTYASRDLKTKSGKTATIALTTPAIAEALTIQDVQITELGIKGLLPKFTVTASSVRQSLEAVLQMLIRKADA